MTKKKAAPKIDQLQIARLDVKPGDTVVIKIDMPLTRSDYENVREIMTPLLPAGVKLLVIDNRADLSVLSA